MRRRQKGKSKTSKASSKGKVRKDDVVAMLIKEDYAQASKMGAAALPHLRRIVTTEDIHLAAKAVHVAGLINLDESVPIVEAAAKSRKPALRVAAAAAANNLTANRAEPILERLLQSKDVGIRKWAIKSSATTNSQRLRAIVTQLAHGDASRDIRNLARSTTSPGLEDV